MLWGLWWLVFLGVSVRRLSVVLRCVASMRRSWGECERLGVSVGGNAENKHMVFRRTLVRDDAALRGGAGLGGASGAVDLRYGSDVALNGVAA